MNQKGNEPMTMLHARIPVDLMEDLDKLAVKSGVSKSEYIRLSLEYMRDRQIEVIKKVSFRDGSGK